MSKSIKCVCLKGDFADMGNHILMPFGVTLCGLPTTDATIADFPQLSSKCFVDLISEYIDKEWDITCEKCIAAYEVICKADQAKKEQNN